MSEPYLEISKFISEVEINREIIDTLIEPTLLKMDCAVNGLEALEY